MTLHDEDANRLLKQFEPLIHKTLQQAHIQTHFRDYDDFAQELRLKLLELATNFDGDPLETDRYRFTHYAGKALRWRALDLIKASQKLDLPSDDDFLHRKLTQDSPSWLNLASQHIQDFLSQAKNALTYSEQLLLDCLIDGSYRIQDLADLLNATPHQIREMKRKLAHTIQPYKGLLEGN